MTPTFSSVAEFRLARIACGILRSVIDHDGGRETRLGRAVLEILQAHAEVCIVRRRGVSAAAALLCDPDGYEILAAVFHT